MAIHERPGKSDEWYTPKYIFDALGTHFNLDVAAPAGGPLHVPCDKYICKAGLEQSWGKTFVWMNPPFGGRNGIVPWLDRFVKHGIGIALFPDRTSAPWWQEFAPKMGVICFVSPKIKFIPGPGVKESSPGQGTCLGALGARGMLALRRCGLGALCEFTR